MNNQPLDQTQLELIKEVFRNEISDNQLSIKKFRVSHSDHFDALDYLEHNSYIIRSGEYYSSKLDSVSLITNIEPLAEQYLEKAQRLFILFQREYRDNPEAILLLSDLQYKLELSRKDINRLVRSMVALPIFSGWTTNIEAEDASVTPAEAVLKYSSLEELLGVIKGWGEKSPTDIYEFNFDKTPAIEEFSFLLHPGIVKTSLRLYQEGHLREAVLNSMTAVFDCIRQKTGLVDDDGDRLIGKVFSLENPYLVLSEILTESGKSDQKGFMQIFKGAYQGIRNPKAHTLEHDLTNLKAAQYLVFASLMMRRIDEATLVAMDEIS